MKRLQQNIIETLSKSSLFSELSEKDLAFVARRAKVRQYFPDDAIVWQGQPSTALFFIMNGIVVVKTLARHKENILAYLLPGQTFGEVGILENQPRSATVMAVSEVDVLVLQREDFLEILHKHSTVAIQLARLLGHYLVQSSRRLANEKRDYRMILLLNTQERTGSTTIGTYLAQTLAETRKAPTAYLEYPNPWRLLRGEQLAAGQTVVHHPGGFDILFPQNDEYLPFATHTTLLLDKVKTGYDNIVINVHAELDKNLNTLLEDANQVVILGSADDKGLRQVKSLWRKAKEFARPEDTSNFYVLTESEGQTSEAHLEEQVDFIIPFLDPYPNFDLDAAYGKVEKPIEEVVETCIDRLERTNSIGLFIPSTIDVDQTVDTTLYMDQAMGFMAERFGGATCKVANGKWNSEEVGLVDEMVYIIQSYITQSDLNRYLDEVVEYIKRLKRELRQEAMAMEVNNKLTLI